MHFFKTGAGVRGDPRQAGATGADRVARLRETFGHYRVPVLVALLLSIASRGQTLFSPQYSIDSYRAAFIPLRSEIYDVLLPQGRFGLAALYWLRDWLGYQGPGVATSSLILAVLGFAAAGVFFARLVLDEPSKAELGLFVAIMTLHPFSTEFFVFSDVTLNIMLGLLLAAVGAFLAARSASPRVAIIGGTSLLVAALSVYQTAIAYVLALCLLALVVRITRPDRQPSAPFWRWRESRALVVALASVAVYLMIATLVSRLVAVPLDARTDLAGLSDAPAKLKLLATALGLALWPVAGLIPRPASGLLLGLLAVAAGLVLAPMLRSRRIVAALLCAMLIAAGLGWAVGASLAGKAIWLVPRVLAPISAFAAGLVMIAWHVSPPRIRIGIGAASAVLVLAYVGASNRILSDQRRLNHWDHQQANRIVARLEQQPRFSDIRAVAIIGGDWRRTTPLATTVGDMNVSALFAPWAKLGLIQEASGYRFEQPTDAETAAAQQHCRDAPQWPAEASVTLIGRVGVVCLPPPK